MDLLLLSGGLDSASLAAWLRPERALVIDYGQRPAAGEVRAAVAVGKGLDIAVNVIHADCSVTGAGLLLGQDSSPLANSPEWWPFRNQLLVTIAAAWGVTRDVKRLMIGTVRTDASRHADATLSFVQQLDQLLTMQEGNMRLVAPAIEYTSGELIRRSGIADSVLAWTHSCHIGEVACGACPGCSKRRDVLAELGRLA